MKDYFIPNLRRTPNPYDGHQLVAEIMAGQPCQWSYKQQFKFGKKTYGHGLLIRSAQAPVSTDYEYVEADILYPKQDELLHFELVACATERLGERQEQRRKRVQLFPHRREQIEWWLCKRADDAGFTLEAYSIEPEQVTVVRKGTMFDMNRTVYQGVLRISDEALFHQTLNQGLGTSRAFGFGLLTIAAY